MPNFNEWLTKAHLISSEQSEKLEGLEKKSGISFGELLLNEKILDSNSYLKILITESHFPLATPGMLRGVTPGISNILSSDLIKKFKCLPLGVIGKRLQVAFLDPTDIVTINEISQASGMEIEPFCCHPDDLFDAIQKTHNTATPEPDKIVVNSTPIEKKKDKTPENLNALSPNDTKETQEEPTLHDLGPKRNDEEKEITKSIEPKEILLCIDFMAFLSKQLSPHGSPQALIQEVNEELEKCSQ
jgi:hypothetical protein